MEDLELELELEEEHKRRKSSPPLPTKPTQQPTLPTQQPTQPSQPTLPTQPTTTQPRGQEPEERWQRNGASVEEAASTRPTNLARSSASSRGYSHHHPKEYCSDHPKSGTVPSYRGMEPRPRYLKPKTGMYSGRSEPRAHPQKFRETRWHSRNAVNGDNANEPSEFSFPCPL